AQGRFRESREGLLSRAVAGPTLDCIVAAGRNKPAVHRIVHAEHAAAVGAPALDLVAVVHFPQADCGVFARARQHIAVRTPTHIADPRAMTAKTEILAS